MDWYSDIAGIVMLRKGEKLAEQWDGNDLGLVAEVDCTSGPGKLLCEEMDIRSFPTLMYGDPHALEEYNGGRSFEELSEFAKENLVPQCSYKNLDLCDKETRDLIEGYLTMSKTELEALVNAEEGKIAAAREKYDADLEALQAKYEEAAKERDEAIVAIRDGGIGLMKAVIKARISGAKEAIVEEKSNDEL